MGSRLAESWRALKNTVKNCFEVETARLDVVEAARKLVLALANALCSFHLLCMMRARTVAAPARCSALNKSRICRIRNG